MEDIIEEDSADIQRQMSSSVDIGTPDKSKVENEQEKGDTCSVASGYSASNTTLAPKKVIPPSEDPYEKAWKYLAKHDILHLFQGITANVFYHKPKDPLEDMIQQIEKLQEEDRIKKGIIKRTTPDDANVA